MSDESEHKKRMLEIVEDLRERVNRLPSSDEVQTVLRGMLVVLKLVIERGAK